MKENRFIELLNLYIDRQITPAEAAELEAEIQDHPAHRETYQQYCRMHHATKLVYESFRAHAADAELTAGAAHTSEVISRFEVQHRRRRSQRWTYYLGGLAAAACVAFVVVQVFPNRPVTPAQSPEVPQTTPVATPPIESTVAVVPVAPPPVEVRPGPVSLRNVYAQESGFMPGAVVLQPASPMMTLANPAAPRVVSLFNDGVDYKPMLPAPANQQRVFQSRPGTLRQQVEFTGFQFQR